MNRNNKLEIARSVFDVVYESTETFREQNIGSDLAYLLGAILDRDKHAFVDWRPSEYGGRPALLDILESRFQPNHPLWGYIEK